MTELQNKFIGTAMRAYRRSPLWPHAGQFLAKALSLATRGRPNIVTKSIDGLTYELHLDEVIDASIYFSGSFEKKIEDLMDDLVLPGATAIDIGANVGYHTVRLARNTGVNGRVIAIEPTSWARVRLERNIELNGFENVLIQALGLSTGEEGNISVSFQSSYPLSGVPINVAEQVRLTSLDILLEELNIEKVDFIKLDVDGYEEKVVRGALQTLQGNHPVLLVEVTPSAPLQETCGALSILEELGYVLFDEDRRFIEQASTSSRWQKGTSPVNLIALPPSYRTGALPRSFTR